jgi:hypothetical protein
MKQGSHGTKQVVIKRSFWGNVLFTLGCAAFTAVGIFILLSDEDVLFRAIAIVCIVLSSGGGLLYLLLMARKPIVVISDKGISVPHGWGEDFVAWENVRKIEVMEQTTRTQGITNREKLIGIFVNKEAGDVGGAGQMIAQQVTGWDEIPALQITLSLSFVKIEKVMGILQEFYNEHKQQSPTQHTTNGISSESPQNPV